MYNSPFLGGRSTQKGSPAAAGEPLPLEQNPRKCWKSKYPKSYLYEDKERAAFKSPSNSLRPYPGYGKKILNPGS